MIFNLVENAVKFTAASHRDGDGHAVRVSVRASRDVAVLEVADSGPGIPPHALPRVFERFYRVDEARTSHGERGFGLGLSIAECIITAHGSTIVARNRAQGGTVVTAGLPLLRMH